MICLGVRTVRNGNGKENEDKKKTKRSRHEHGSVKNSLTHPGRHASAKKSTYHERRAVFNASDLI